MIYRFDFFELDEARFELRELGNPRALPCKSFELLRYMLENAGRVVTKQEIFDRLWHEQHVGASVLPVHIRTIRRALGAPASKRILETIRGRGYIVRCSVEQIGTVATNATLIDLQKLSRARRRTRVDPLRDLAHMSGLASLALGLGGLGLADDSLELLGRAYLLPS
jgi:DNA-binding winged helix-turn-helix (wHTH) protein